MKTIESVADLAIYGAPPAFDKPLHVGRPNLGDKATFMRYVDEIFERNWLTNDGPLVKEFERRIAAMHRVKHCVAMSNGTVALEIAIRALELEGEVIVPSYTFIATAHALHWQAITPVFADIDTETHNLSAEAVEAMITPRTTGIIGVHLWGRTAPVDSLEGLAHKHGLRLMFDAAHAIGCSHRGTMVGSFGDCEVLSFHATKPLNSFEGGAVLTNDGDLAERMRLMRNFGFAGKDNVIYPGTNGKMVEAAAAMGLVNLESLPRFVEANKSNYETYRRQLRGVAGVSLLAFDENESNNYQYIVLQLSDSCPLDRDYVVNGLVAENVLARRYFWPGCHRMKPYRDFFPHAGLLLPNTEEVAARVIVLPNGISMDQEQIACVCSIIRCLLEGGS